MQKTLLPHLNSYWHELLLKKHVSNLLTSRNVLYKVYRQTQYIFHRVLEPRLIEKLICEYNLTVQFSSILSFCTRFTAVLVA